MRGEQTTSDQLARWFREPCPRTLGSFVERFGAQSFALVFILLMAVPALPLPTGGVTHVLEIVAMLLALELVAGRREIWLPRRLRGLEIARTSNGGFATRLVRRIRWFENFSHPRARFLFDHRLSGVVFGAVVFFLSLAAFLAPPFTGLDTLPALGVVIFSLGVLFEDAVLVALGLTVGCLGAVVIVGFGGLVGRWILHRF